jgi:AcrR family transcriptional regulator
MGIKERHERERESVRSAILDAARTLFTTEGYQNVSIRKIAERIEYSPAAIYSYFPSKDDIFFALAEEGFQLMVEMGEDAPVADSPLDTLRGRLGALYRFSVAHPEHCALMFFDRSVPRIIKHREQFRLLVDMRRRMAEGLQQCVDGGELPRGTEPYAALRVLLTAAQGAVAARLFNRLAPSEDGEALAHDVVELAIAGIRAGAPISFRAFPGECHLAGEPGNEIAESSTSLAGSGVPPPVPGD